MKQTHTEFNPASCAAFVTILILLGIIVSAGIWVIVQIWESM